MRRIPASLLLVAQLALLAGPALAGHHGELGGHACCHEMTAPGNEHAVEGPVECAHCSIPDCAGKASCTGATNAVVSSAALGLVEQFVPAGQSDLVSHEISISPIPLLPPPRA